MSTPADPASVDELRWTSPGLLVAVLVAVFIAAFGITVALPHNPYIRFQQLAETIQFRSQWVYERIELDPTPIDVAIVGNSRLEAGISGPQLQSALRRSTGRDLRVANLSMPQEGRNAHFLIVKRLLEKHPEVKLIILSAIEQMPRGGHPAFGALADTDDVIGAPILINLDYANDMAALPFRQMSLFVQSLAPGLFGQATRLEATDYPGTDYDATRTFKLPDGRIVDRDSIVPEAELARATKAIRKATPVLLPNRLREYEFAQERFYTRQIAQMAKAKGVSIIFVQLPIYRNQTHVRDVAFYRPVGPIVRAGFIANDYRLFSDYGHVNVHGSRLATAWLADRIIGFERTGVIRPLMDAAGR